MGLAQIKDQPKLSTQKFLPCESWTHLGLILLPKEEGPEQDPPHGYKHPCVS